MTETKTYKSSDYLVACEATIQHMKEDEEAFKDNCNKLHNEEQELERQYKAIKKALEEKRNESKRVVDHNRAKKLESIQLLEQYKNEYSRLYQYEAAIKAQEDIRLSLMKFHINV